MTDPDDDASLGRLGEDQIQIVLTLRQYVVTYTDGPDDAWRRMPNVMTFLDEAFPISASLYGEGRDQLVEVLRHDEPKTPSPEYVVERRDQIEEPTGEEGGSRGF